MKPISESSKHSEEPPNILGSQPDLKPSSEQTVQVVFEKIPEPMEEEVEEDEKPDEELCSLLKFNALWKEKCGRIEEAHGSEEEERESESCDDSGDENGDVTLPVLVEHMGEQFISLITIPRYRSCRLRPTLVHITFHLTISEENA